MQICLFFVPQTINSPQVEKARHVAAEPRLSDMTISLLRSLKILKMLTLRTGPLVFVCTVIRCKCISDSVVCGCVSDRV